MTSEPNIFSFGNDSAGPLAQARAALRAVRQYQQDWHDLGVNRVYKYFEDVDGEWLENFDEISTESPAEPVLIESPVEPILDATCSDIFSQLRSLGLPNSFIQEFILPSWWNSELEKDRGSLFKLVMSLAQRLSLKTDFLQDPSAFSLEFLPLATAKFKLQERQKKQKTPELFSYLARGVAIAVASTIECAYVPIPSDASAMRASILQQSACVSLDSLLDFCWQSGIPVVHFDQKPNGCVKADGLVVMTENRPAIVIGSSRKQSAWLLFTLAHELGHIAQGHIQTGVLVDQSILNGVKDEEEDAANQFAAQLLFGGCSVQWTPNLTRESLQEEARRLGEAHQIDPGALVLNYGWQMKDWPCAAAALKLLEPEANAPAQINARYQHHLTKRHLTKIDKERRDYLERLKILAPEGCSGAECTAIMATITVDKP